MKTTDPSRHVFDTHFAAEATIRTLGRSSADKMKLSLSGKGCQSGKKAIGFHTASDRIKAWGGTGDQKQARAVLAQAQPAVAA